LLDMKEGHGPLFLNPFWGREPQSLLHKIRDTTVFDDDFSDTWQ